LDKNLSQIPMFSDRFRRLSCFTMTTEAIMVLGTMSHSGKSTLTAALCRYAARHGRAVAPFKAQNMSLNSHVTPEGGEIGRAQVVQARAAGIESHSDMNPVLLKPTSAQLMQVVVNGMMVGNFTAQEYYSRHLEWREFAHQAYDRLASRYDLIVLEGAGSPAEINLRQGDFVNAAMGEYARARFVLVADIDRGGVFASILGTLQLMEKKHRDRVVGVIINKFRGDVTLLNSGIQEIEHLTGIPILGVIPFLDDLHWEEEDSLGLPTGVDSATALLDIAVLRLPYISNFTDFLPFQGRPGLSLRYVSKPEMLGNPDLIFLPGTKNVRHDMDYLRQSGLEKTLLAAAARHIPLFGICGGYQILGQMIHDPLGLEGEVGSTAGLNLLAVETTLELEKEMCRVAAQNTALPFLPEGAPCSGYEIHLGLTKAIGPGTALLKVLGKNDQPCSENSGFISPNGLVWGTYLHGLFDLPETQSALLQWLAGRKGLAWRFTDSTDSTNDMAVFDRLADALEKHVNLQPIFGYKSVPKNHLQVKYPPLLSEG
jgi:adenosylcobyric acid synthase